MIKWLQLPPEVAQSLPSLDPAPQPDEPKHLSLIYRLWCAGKSKWCWLGQHKKSSSTFQIWPPMSMQRIKGPPSALPPKHKWTTYKLSNRGKESVKAYSRIVTNVQSISCTVTTTKNAFNNKCKSMNWKHALLKKDISHEVCAVLSYFPPFFLC